MHARNGRTERQKQDEHGELSVQQTYHQHYGQQRNCNDQRHGLAELWLAEKLNGPDEINLSQTEPYPILVARQPISTAITRRASRFQNP